MDNGENTEVCPKCKGSMWITWTDENGCEMGKRCDCFEPTMTSRRIANSNISAAFRSKGFKNFDTRGIAALEKAWQACVDYCKEYPTIQETRQNSMLLLGVVGAGKTHLALASANAILDYHKVGVRYMGYREMMTKLKQSITDESGYMANVEPLKKAPMLVIDDMLKGKVTESDVNILFEIVNYRYVCNLPMIVTSEKSTSELLEFDSAIGSRLIEMAGCRIIEFRGRELNYRLKGINDETDKN